MTLGAGNTINFPSELDKVAKAGSYHSKNNAGGEITITGGNGLAQSPQIIFDFGSFRKIYAAMVIAETK